MITKKEKHTATTAATTDGKSIREMQVKTLDIKQMTMLLGGNRNAIVEENAEGI